MNNAKARRRANRLSRQQKIAVLMFELRSAGVPAEEVEPYLNRPFREREYALGRLRGMASNLIGRRQ